MIFGGQSLPSLFRWGRAMASIWKRKTATFGIILNVFQEKCVFWVMLRFLQILIFRVFLKLTTLFFRSKQRVGNTHLVQRLLPQKSNESSIGLFAKALLIKGVCVCAS